MSTDNTTPASPDDDDHILANRPGDPVRFYDDLPSYWLPTRIPHTELCHM